MPEILSVLLIVSTAILILFALLALFTLGSVRLHSILGVLRDGPEIGAPLPPLVAVDAHGNSVRLPADHWQLILFGHQGLREFPEVVEAIRGISEVGEVDVVWLARETGAEDGHAMALELDLGTAPVFVDGAIYGHYNVRAIPFVVIVDPGGLVRGRGLVNHKETLDAILGRARQREVVSVVVALEA